jgi:hypothetical protein
VARIPPTTGVPLFHRLKRSFGTVIVFTGAMVAACSSSEPMPPASGTSGGGAGRATGGGGGTRTAGTGGDAGMEAGTGAGDDGGAGNEAAGAGASDDGGAGGRGGRNSGTGGGDAGAGASDDGGEGNGAAGVGAGMGGTGGQPASGLSSDQLIDAAVQAGTLTDELGLLYKVYAVFDDPRLPAEYVARDQKQMDTPIMAIAAERYSTLTPATQALLRPFFIPPTYAQSWYASRLPQQAQLLFNGGASDVPTRPADLPGDLFVFCTLLGGIGFTETVTDHFKIHTPPENFSYGNEVETGQIIAANAEAVYAAVTDTFERFPLSDIEVSPTCGGGDHKVDIYVTGGSYEPGVRAVTIAYKGCGSPSFILIKADRDPEKIKAALAHEFFHVLELGAYEFSAACDDYRWLGEATANLAIELSFPTEQVEHDEFARYFAFGERMTPIDEPYDDNRYRSNGYGDYVFLQYVAEKFGHSVVKAVWDGTASADSVGALTAAVGTVGGGLSEVWPDFALASWNDTEENLAGAFYGYDTFTYGIKEGFDEGDAGRESGQKSIAVKLDGASRKTFDLLASAPTAGQVPRLSIQADYLKFTDSNVRSVMYVNAMAFGDVPNLRIQALAKVAGQWQAAEDWTKVTHKSFCRDKKDETIQELVLLYSNSDGERPSPPISFFVPPKLSVSNVGCFRWEGVSSKTVSGTDISTGAVVNETTSATGLVFERVRFPELPDGSPGFESFAPSSGDAEGTSTTVNGCTFTSEGSGPVDTPDINLQINLDVDLGGGPTDRLIRMGTGSTSLPTSNRVACPDVPDLTSEGTAVWGWLSIPLHAGVSADGTTLEGTHSEIAPITGITTTSTWHLTAQREP